MTPGLALPSSQPRRLIVWVWQAVRSTDRRIWWGGLALTLALSVIKVQWLIGASQHVGLWHAFVGRWILQTWVTAVLLVAWAIADAAEDSRWPRSWRLGMALVGGSLLASATFPVWMEGLGLRDAATAMMRAKGEEPPPMIFEILVDALNVMLISALIFAAIEVTRRRILTRRAIEAAAAERTRLTRRMFESRLAAMQAQVEPRFLFDALVAIEHLYERDSSLAASTLDELIAYLRVALPRLRDSGSTLGEEFSLLDAYGRVLARLDHGAPQLRFELPPELATQRFAPMLLLPLLQSASKNAQVTSLAARARASDKQLVVELEFQGGHPDRDARSGVSERLAGLYGPSASLSECASAATIRITLPMDAKS